MELLPLERTPRALSALRLRVLAIVWVSGLAGVNITELRSSGCDDSQTPDAFASLPNRLRFVAKYLYLIKIQR